MENAPQQLDLRQSEEYAKYMSANGWVVVKIRAQNDEGTVNMFVRKIGPMALAKMQRPARLPDVFDLKRTMKEGRIFMLKFEPAAEIGSGQLDVFCGQMGLRRDNSPLLATKTRIISLFEAPEQIMASFEKDTRYVLRKLQAEGHQARLGDLELFYRIWRESAKRKRLWIPGKAEYQRLIEAFGNKAVVITVGKEAGACVLITGQTAYYYYAGATAEGNKKNWPYLVVWEGMMKAKEMGCGWWDFEGVFDQRWPNKNWQGFSRFKNSFLGKTKDFPGAFSLWRLPV